MKKTTLDEFIEIAIQTKRTHRELMKLFDLTSGKIPKGITTQLFRIQDAIFKFKSQAEDRMVEQHPDVLNMQTQDYPSFSNIFYGGFKILEKDGE